MPQRKRPATDTTHSQSQTIPSIHYVFTDLHQVVVVQPYTPKLRGPWLHRVNELEVKVSEKLPMTLLAPRTSHAGLRQCSHLKIDLAQLHEREWFPSAAEPAVAKDHLDQPFH